MAHHEQIETDPRQVEEALRGWADFTKLMKWSIIGVVLIMAFLGLALIDW